MKAKKVNVDSWVARARSRDLSRPTLCVVWREPLKRRTFATDGHRLHVATGDYPAGDPTYVVPKGKSFANVAPSIMFPLPIDNVLGPTRSGVSIDGQALLQAIAAANLDDKPENRIVVLASREGHVEVYSTVLVDRVVKIRRKTATYHKRFRDVLVARIQTAPAMPYSSDIGVQASYLIDALAGTGELRLALVSPHDPVRIDHADGRIALVMPMRIDER